MSSEVIFRQYYFDKFTQPPRLWKQMLVSNTISDIINTHNCLQCLSLPLRNKYYYLLLFRRLGTFNINRPFQKCSLSLQPHHPNRETDNPSAKAVTWPTEGGGSSGLTQSVLCLPESMSRLLWTSWPGSNQMTTQNGGTRVEGSGGNWCIISCINHFM